MFDSSGQLSLKKNYSTSKFHFHDNIVSMKYIQNSNFGGGGGGGMVLVVR